MLCRIMWIALGLTQPSSLDTAMEFVSMEDQFSKRVFFTVLAIFAVFCTGLVVLFGAAGIGIVTGHLASTEVLPATRIPARQLETVSSIIEIRPDEQILYFYSSAMTVSGDGNLLTNQRVVSYVSEGDTHRVDSANYEDIDTVQFDRGDDWLDDSTLDVNRKDESMFSLLLSIENDGDKEFQAELQKRINRLNE